MKPSDNKKFIGVVIDPETNLPVESEKPFIGWYSRSMGISVVITNKEHNLFLLEKRGDGCPDFIGCYCCPCGYLNWDETLIEAAIREVYEETGLLLQTDDLQVLAINDNPNETRQNVTIRFLAEFDTDVLYQKHASHCNIDTLSRGGEGNEVSDIVLMSADDILLKDKSEFAFNHHDLLKDIILNFDNLNLFV